jgi:hypothetical protein
VLLPETWLTNRYLNKRYFYGNISGLREKRNSRSLQPGDLLLSFWTMTHLDHIAKSLVLKSTSVVARLKDASVTENSILREAPWEITGIEELLLSEYNYAERGTRSWSSNGVPSQQRPALVMYHQRLRYWTRHNRSDRAVRCTLARWALHSTSPEPRKPSEQ